MLRDLVLTICRNPCTACSQSSPQTFPVEYQSLTSNGHLTFGNFTPTPRATCCSSAPQPRAVSPRHSHTGSRMANEPPGPESNHRAELLPHSQPSITAEVPPTTAPQLLEPPLHLLTRKPLFWGDSILNCTQWVARTAPALSLMICPTRNLGWFREYCTTSPFLRV